MGGFSKALSIKLPKSWLKKPKGFKPINPKLLKEDMERLGMDLAKGFKDAVVENIKDNKFGYANAASTILRKGSDTPLIDTGELVDSIQADGTLVFVEDTPREDSTLTNKELAIVLEYGTKDKHIPPRRVWRKTFDDYRRYASEHVLEFLKIHRFTDVLHH